MRRGGRLLAAFTSALGFLAVAATAFLMAFGVGRMLDAGLRGRLADARERDTSSTLLQQEVSAAERLASDFRAECGRLVEERLKVAKMLPPRPDPDGAIADLVQSGAELGVAVERQRVGAAVEREFYRVTPLEVDLRGPLAAILDLTSRLERNLPLVEPSELQISWSPDSELPSVSLTLELVSYPESEPAER